MPEASFAATGISQGFTVPSGVTELEVLALGAAGGNGGHGGDTLGEPGADVPPQASGGGGTQIGGGFPTDTGTGALPPASLVGGQGVGYSGRNYGGCAGGGAGWYGGGSSLRSFGSQLNAMGGGGGGSSGTVGELISTALGASGGDGFVTITWGTGGGLYAGAARL